MLTIVSVNVVQHMRHWHATKIVHVEIAVAVPSLSLRQGKAPTTVVVIDCVACGVMSSAGCPVHVLRWTTR